MRHERRPRLQILITSPIGGTFKSSPAANGKTERSCAASRTEDPFRLRRPGPGDHSIVRQERNILLVVLDGLGSGTLRQAVRRRLGEAAHVHMVAPSRVGTLDWLAPHEDAARATAEVQALEAEWALADDADVDAEAGDGDPILPGEDALRRFDAG